ncbi:MAG: hypothetical protein HGA38_01665 [Candidatus Moranbacteria bacterium]|nr:hypothetical protein [Candidatus Moranbacteria bacterium]
MKFRYPFPKPNWQTYRGAVLTAGAVLFWVLSVAVLTASVRGLPGNPNTDLLRRTEWRESGPLELSPERGRFALLYSMVEDHSLHFSVDVAKMAVPDLAINAVGEYVSLFAPAVSAIVIPGYVLGRAVGVAQVGAFSVISLLALFNMALIVSISRRLGASRFAGILAAAVFGFATPAFAYAVTLYQHHVSTFLLLFSVWLIQRFRHPLAFAGVWFLAALSVVVDNPNVFLMFPVGLYALILFVRTYRDRISRNGKPFLHGFLYLLTFVVMAFPLGGFLWYNQVATGNPLQLPGTLRDVEEIGPDGRPVEVSAYERETGLAEDATERSAASTEKTAVGFFKTRNLYQGFFTHFVSRDRGIIFFTPVILLGIVGLVLLYRKETEWTALLIAIIGVDVLLYSMWGDPWGGWAFGSRYLIPAYAILAIGLSVALSRWRFRWVVVSLFVPLFLYSAWVNTLGAVTTSMIPPEKQVLVMEQQSGHEEKYTYMRSWEFLHEKYSSVGVKSFVYQAWARGRMAPEAYFLSVYGAVSLTALCAVLGLALESRKRS